MTRSVPHDLEAEVSLIGSMLLSRGATLAAVDAGVTAATFYRPAFGAIFDACVQIVARGGIADPVTVAAELNGTLEKVGGRNELVVLRASCPASANAPQYARIIVEHERARTAIADADRLASAAYSGDLDAVARIAAELQVSNVDGARRVTLRNAASIEMAPVAFAFRPFIPLGNVSGCIGEPGKGKSTLMLYITAGITRGTLPGDYFGRPARVLIQSGEDSPETTLAPRLCAAGADLELVDIVTVTEDGLEDGLNLPGDIAALEAAVTEDTALLVVDPLMAALDASIDSHKDQSIRRAIAPLFRLANTTGIAVVFVAHLNKQASGSFIQRVGGSVGLTGAVRSAMLVGHDPERPEIDTARLLVHGKHNLSAQAPSQRFDVIAATIETDPPISTALIRWGEQAPHLTAEDVLRGPAYERPAPKRDAAVEMLEWMLADGPRRRTDIEAEAKRRDVSWRTVETAKRDLGIRARQIPEPGKQGAGPSWWYFPTDEPNGPQSTAPQCPASAELTDHSFDAEPAPILASRAIEDKDRKEGNTPTRESADH